MKKGRSTYSFRFSCDVQTINNLIQGYLSGNGFRLHEKKGEQYFRAGDSMIGYKGFKYNFEGQTIVISAWLDGALGNFPVEQNSLNMLAMDYRNSLGPLFNEISNLSNGGNNMNNNQNNFNNSQMNFDPVTGQPLQNNGQNNTQFVQNFQSQTDKKKETMCEIGFWISIFGLLGSFGGVAMGLLVYVMDFYFAAQGLKTRKRGKAIATIVMSILSILVVVFSLMASV